MKLHPPSLKISLLGRFEVENQGQILTGLRTRRAEALLIFLACHQSLQPRDVLATLFWADFDQTAARRNLNNTLYWLRQALGDYVISRPHQAGLVESEAVWLDVAIFKRQLEGLSATTP